MIVETLTKGSITLDCRTPAQDAALRNLIAVSPQLSVSAGTPRPTEAPAGYTDVDELDRARRRLAVGARAEQARTTGVPDFREGSHLSVLVRDWETGVASGDRPMLEEMIAEYGPIDPRAELQQAIKADLDAKQRLEERLARIDAERERSEQVRAEQQAAIRRRASYV